MPEIQDLSPIEPARHDSAILLIEDNRGDAVLIEAMLAEVSELDQPLVHASRLEDGLELVAGAGVGVVLADLSLPDSTGLETFRALHRRAPLLPIIVLTGSRDRKLALRAIQEGAQDYLVKDEVNGPALSKAIHYAIERKQAEVRLRDSEHRYKSLVAAVPDAILLLKEDRIVDCNARASRLFGFEPEELAGRTVGTLSPARQPSGADSADAFAARARAAYDARQPQWFEWQFQRIDGRLVATEVILDLATIDGEQQVMAIVRDLTERKQAESRIRFQASLLNQVHNAVFATDDGDQIVFWNRYAAQLYQWDEAEVVGRRASDLILPSADRDLVDGILAGLDQEQTWEGELALKRKDGTTFPALLTLSALHDENGKLSGFAGVASDITERVEVEKKLEYSAFHDALTGLPNRALFTDRLARAIARGSREGGRYAVLVMDLDRFKVINDSLGHLIGDELLIQFSRRVESCLRPGDTLARLGGDEFTILLEDVQHTSDAIRVAERINEKMSQPFLLGSNEVYTSASIGITFGTADYQEPAQAIRDADIAMYRAKGQERGCHVIFESGMHDRAVTQLKRETRMRRALEHDEFAVHFQPIVELESGQCVGCEALLRWNKPSETGRSAPQELIAIAEETGLIIPIGQKVLDEACAQLQSWRASFPLAEDFSIHINLTTKQFCHRGLTSQLGDALARHGLNGRSITLEINERVLMEHPVLAAAMLGDLRELDVHVCVDDFGTGYSSLGYLHQFPVDVIKIDRSFTHGLGRSITSSAIVQAIIGLGANLGMHTVAEGVETDQHRRQLIDLGCRYAQGFLFNPALEPEAMASYLRQAAQVPQH